MTEKNRNTMSDGKMTEWSNRKFHKYMDKLPKMKAPTMQLTEHDDRVENLTADINRLTNIIEKMCEQQKEAGTQ